MVDIDALMDALPVSGLEPQTVAFLEGIVDLPKDQAWQAHIDLIEPPAALRVPFIEPVSALEKMLLRKGVAPEDALLRAREAGTRLQCEVAEDRWAIFFDSFEPEKPECLPVPDFTAWLRDEALDLSDLADFFERAAAVAAREAILERLDTRDESWTLETLPRLTPPKAMIEFVPGGPWSDIDACGNWRETDNPFKRWREAIRPAALYLEQALGKRVYYFADLDDDCDDDDVHRFLVLHWCCSFMPQSSFVRWIVRKSGARDVEELKCALIDPASYRHPFQMNDAFGGIDTVPCHFEYLPPGNGTMQAPP
jgi:hypothetical protein